jgi:serine/threonine protein kinase
MGQSAVPTRRRGPWSVGLQIGSGGQSQVFVAWREGEQQDQYVIKEMKTGRDRSNRSRSLAAARFAGEIGILERLREAGISGVAEIVDHCLRPADGGPPWLVMRRYRQRLHDSRERFLGDIDATLDTVSRLADTLTAIHAIGTAHRDVKMKNIFFDDASEGPILGDFGLEWSEQRSTSITAAGDTLGPAVWRPPEFRAGGFRGDLRKSDIYLLGGLLYELLMNKRFEESEYRGQFTHETGEYRLAERIEDPRIPHVNTLLRDMLARDPELRADAHDVAERCRAIGTFRPGAPPPPTSNLAERARRVAADLRETSASAASQRTSDELRQAIERALLPLGPQRWAPQFEFSAFIHVVAGDEASRNLLSLAAQDRSGFDWAAARPTADYEMPSWRAGPLMSYISLGRRRTAEDIVVYAPHDAPPQVVGRFPAGDPRAEEMIRDLAVRERDRLLEQVMSITQQRGAC